MQYACNNFKMFNYIDYVIVFGICNYKQIDKTLILCSVLTQGHELRNFIY